ncbi:hypothetical protein B0H11DRAFT_2253042 [Mycena galericulata]|nr:hypothetical protein B0H11DRAFT_2253042 [Mycena galericulata]
MASNDPLPPSNCDGDDKPHTHVLSDKSVALGRDTFFFAPMGRFPIRLVAGLNQNLTPVTMATLQRWVNLMAGDPTVFCICPVNVEPYGIMSYSISPSGRFIDPDSTDPLLPGNYGWYRDHNFTQGEFPRFTGVDGAMRDKSFEYNVTFMDDERLLALYKFPLDIERRVLARDARKCMFTGAIDEVMVMWIVPPPWAWAVAHPSDPPGIAPTSCSTDIHPLEVDPAPFLVAANAITIRKDLKVHFYNHAFAVDADDDFRVIVFRDMGDAQRLLPTRLSRDADSDDHDADFFRLHLRYSLSFMLLGGDVTEKYPPHRILNEMQKLGVSAGGIGGEDPDDSEMVAFTDERWFTELGQAIFANVMRVRTDDECESDLGSGEADVEPRTYPDIYKYD